MRSINVNYELYREDGDGKEITFSVTATIHAGSTATRDDPGSDPEVDDIKVMLNDKLLTDEELKAQDITDKELKREAFWAAE